MSNSNSNTNGRYPPHLIYTGEEGVLFQGNCLSLLNQMLPDSVDLVFADPPFNLGKSYDSEAFTDTLETKKYMSWCQKWLTAIVRVLRPGGSLFLYHWPKWLIELGHWLNTLTTLEYRSWIALTMKSGFPIKNRLHPAHYGILYYTKRGDKYTFNVVRSRTPVCRHCGKEIRDYGGYREKFKKYEDEDGIPWIQISDFWEDTRPARQDKSRRVQVAELPLHIPERAILMASNPGDVVLDVFGGSGSTYHAAQLHGRRWIGCEVGDVTPILRRLETVFKLNHLESIDSRLGKCFKKGFILRELALFIKENRMAKLKEIEPFSGTVGSFHEYASKSRIIEANAKEVAEL
jgi:site-specific DNA-methyltransferase (adenine-specific)